MVFLWLHKKSFLNSCQGNCFYKINFYNQEGIHHIHCFGCIIYHQIMIKKFFYAIGFYSMIFTLDSVDRLLKHSLFNKASFYLL